MLQLLEQHRSPDSLLTLRIGRYDDGDISIGFDGYSWHTHADILASLSGLGEDEAVRQFVDNLLGGPARHSAQSRPTEVHPGVRG
jgi:hypothetical protein